MAGTNPLLAIGERGDVRLVGDEPFGGDVERLRQPLNRGRLRCPPAKLDPADRVVSDAACFGESQLAQLSPFPQRS